MLSEDKRIKTRAQLREYLEADLAGFPKGGVQRLINLLDMNESAILRRHMILLRRTEYYLNTNQRLLAGLYKLRLRRLQRRYGMYVSPNCCGKGLRIMHLGPLLLNSRVTVGENCSFQMNAGVVAGGTDDGVPTLGDGVMVGMGAVILGGIYVADNVAVGANAVVNKDVAESDIAVAGVPARKISDNGSAAWHTGVRDRHREKAEG